MKQLQTLVLVFLCAGFISCNNETLQPKFTSHSKQDSIAAMLPPETVQEPQFNVQDKNIETNGNRAVVYNKVLKISPKETCDNAKTISISKITKNPFTYLGQLVKLHGTVSEVEQMPPDAAYPGAWYSVLFILPNPNSKLGGTTVNLHYNGDFNAEPGSTVTFAGYFVGMYESKNGFGGLVTGVLIAGNYAK